MATRKVYPGVGHVGMILALATILPFDKAPVLDDILALLAAQREPSS